MLLDKVTNEAYQTALRLAETGLYSDFTIKCGEKEYRVHKVLICTRSQFFAKACSGNFQEGQTGVVDLSHDDPEAVDSMLCYIYNGHYPRTLPDTVVPADIKYNVREFWEAGRHGEAMVGIGPEYLSLHAKVYALAEKYAVTGLKEMAIRYFTAAISLPQVAEEQIFADAIETAYNETIDSDRGLRDVIVSFLYFHSDVLKQDHVQAVLKTCPNLSFDIVMYHNKAEQKKQEQLRLNSFQAFEAVEEWEFTLP